MKKWIVDKFGKGANVSQAIVEVEKSPESKARQMVLAEEMGKVNIAEEPKLLALVEDLVTALKKTEAGCQVDARGAKVGVIGDHVNINGGINFREK